MSEDRWLYRLNGIEFGPVSFETIADMCLERTLGEDDEICAPKGEWKRIGDVVGLMPTEEEFAEADAAAAEAAAGVGSDDLDAMLAVAETLPSEPDDASEASELDGIRFVGEADAPQVGVPEQPLVMKISDTTVEEISQSAAAKRPKPESMSSVVSALLAEAEEATSIETKPRSHVSPQRLGVSAKSTPESSSDESAAAEPKQSPATTSADTTAASPASVSTPDEPGPGAQLEQDAAAETEPPRPSEPANPSAAETPDPPKPVADVPKPAATPAPKPAPAYKPPAFQSGKAKKSRRGIDPALVKIAGIGVGAIAVLAGLWFGAGAVGGLGGPKVSVASTVWPETDAYVKGVGRIVESGNGGVWKQMSGTVLQRGEEIKDSAERLSTGSPSDEALKEAIIDLIDRGVLPLNDPKTWTESSAGDLDAMRLRVQELAEG